MVALGDRVRAAVGHAWLVLAGLVMVVGRGADGVAPSPGRWLLVDRGLGLGEGRHRLCLTNEPGSRVIGEVLGPGDPIGGTAALFEVHARGHASLRRLPAVGREDEAVALCRVMAAPQGGFERGKPDEAPAVEGKWRVVSHGLDGAVHRLGWEWWSDGNGLAGRFDPGTDFRFAHMLRGTNGGGRVAFAVEYIQDRYDVSGGITANGWAGTWRKRGESDAGTWTAVRSGEEGRGARDVDARRAEPLRAWTRVSDGACWVGLGNDRPEGVGWGEPVRLGAAWRHQGRPGGGGAGDAGNGAAPGRGP